MESESLGLFLIYGSLMTLSSIFDKVFIPIFLLILGSIYYFKNDANAKTSESQGGKK